MVEENIERYEEGWKTRHDTKLQQRLRSLYRNSRGDLGENSEVLKQITEIAGNRGHSHANRLEKITQVLNGTPLSESGKTYQREFLKVYRDYLDERKHLKTGQVGLTRRIKYFSGVIRSIRELEGNLEPNGFVQYAAIESAVIEKSLEYRLRKSEGQGIIIKMRLLRRAGKWVAGAAAAVLLMASVASTDINDGPKAQTSDVGALAGKPVAGEVRKETKKEARIPDAEVRIEEREGMISQKQYTQLKQKFDSLSEKYEEEIAGFQEFEKKERSHAQELEKKLAAAGRPDAEVRIEAERAAGKRVLEKLRETTIPKPKYEALTNENQGLRLVVESYRNAEKPEVKPVDELSEDIHTIASALSLPAFPWARAVIDKQTGIMEEVGTTYFFGQRGFSVIDTGRELRELSSAASDYEAVPREGNERAFEDFATTLGVSQRIIGELDPEKKEVTNLDRLVLLSQEFEGSKNGLIVREDIEKKKIIVIGNLDLIKSLKSKK